VRAHLAEDVPADWKLFIPPKHVLHEATEQTLLQLKFVPAVRILFEIITSMPSRLAVRVFFSLSFFFLCLSVLVSHVVAPYAGQYLKVDGLSQAVEKKNIVYQFVDESQVKNNTNNSGSTGNSANQGAKKMPAWFKPGT
jgi:hypothetical protein